MGSGAYSSVSDTNCKMNRNSKLPMLLAVLLSLTAFDGLWADSLEFGHVRARSRGWIDSEEMQSNAQEPVAEKPTLETIPPQVEEIEVTQEEVDVAVESETTMTTEVDSEELEMAEPEPTRRLSIGKQVSSTVRSTVDTAVRGGKRIMLIGKREHKPKPKHGYLVMGGPPSVRFSDFHSVVARPPAPALPEFSYEPGEDPPYLIESALPEEERQDNSRLAEVVVELEPHEVVSGKIETKVRAREDHVEDFSIDEQRTTVLKPEEVLIFFESDSVNSNSARAIVPFSPAQPTTETSVESSATLKKK